MASRRGGDVIDRDDWIGAILSPWLAWLPRVGEAVPVEDEATLIAAQSGLGWAAPYGGESSLITARGGAGVIYL